MKTNKINIFAAIILLIFLSGCTKSHDVPADKYAILLSLGKIQKSIEGPAKLDKVIVIEHIVYISKQNQIIVGDKYTIKYTVTNPEQYYKKLFSNSRLQQLVEKEIATLALNGKLIKNKKDLLEIIEKMNFPIKVNKNA